MLEAQIGKRYKLIAVLGVGGFGQTYLAEDTQQPGNPQCVVKQFKPAMQDARFLQVARRLFETEVATLEKLGQHPQIPQFLDFFEEEGEFYLVQEFIDGLALNDKLSSLKRLNETEAIALLQDVLGILEFVHQNQVIHRDIKPANLIQRHQDKKMVLIDFGAVKEIRTRLINEVGRTDFTVGIGTQGYTASEQLAGQPRYCSDIYGLGMTVIQAVTGLQPSQLPTDPDTAEPIWQDRAPISLGLRVVLEKMVRYHFSQRYQSASEVLQALQGISETSSASTVIPSALLTAEAEVYDQTGNLSRLNSTGKTWWKRAKAGFQGVTIATLTVTGLLLGVRQLGWLQASELAVYDQMIRSRPDPGADPRLLMVAITEADLQALQRPTPSDQTVAQAIEKLAQFQPSVIALDLHRELPQEPGHAALLKQLRGSAVVTILTLGDANKIAVPPPPGLPPEQAGFNDFPIDPDGIIRRNLIFASTHKETYYSFSLRTALNYLEKQGISPRASSTGDMQLGKQVFLPLEANSGGYQNIDAAGYQILLDYRSANHPARQISFTDVLQGRLDPNWVRGKVVLIGTTAPSGKDLFFTPYSAGEQAQYLMPGVIVHAQMISQILRVGLGETQLSWFFPEWAEVLWIGSWAALGGSLAWWVRHPFALGVSIIVGLALLSGITLLIFSQQGWVPGVAPAIALILTGVTVVSWRSYLYRM